MNDPIPDAVLEKGPYDSWELVIEDSLHLKNFYIRLIDFLVDEGFTDLYEGKENFETYYYEKEKEDGTKEHKIWWRASRLATISPRKNLKFYIAINISTLFLKKVEQIVEGNKVKLDSGEFKTNFYLYLDYENNEASPEKYDWIMKLFSFNSNWKKERQQAIEAFEDEGMAFSRDLYSFIQSFAGVTPQTRPRDFVPFKGIGN